MSTLELHPDRALPFAAEQRSVAREIYAETKDLPLISMHGHVEPEVFAEDQAPSAETADAIYDQIAACVADPEFRPRALLDRFRIEVISTTDAAASDLHHHEKLAADGLGERVLPTFRPDALVYLDKPTWRNHVAELARVSGVDTTTYEGFLEALRARRAAFVAAAARATDHGHLRADTTPMDAKAAGD